MPLLDQPDTSIYRTTKLFSTLSGPGQLSGGGQASGPSVAMAKFQADQQEEQDVRQMAQQYQDDPAGLVKAVTAKYPERGLKMDTLLQQSIQNHAESEVKQTAAGIADMNYARRWLQIGYDKPEYADTLKQIATAKFGDQAASLIPDKADPQYADKMVALIEKLNDTDNFLKARHDSAKLYLDDKPVEGALTLLSGAKTPEQLQFAQGRIKAVGLGEMLNAYDPASAQAELDRRKALGQKEGAGPKLGSFEDYVGRFYGQNPTKAQVLQARKEYGQADDRVRVSVSGAGAPVPTDLATLARQAGMTVDALKRQADVYHIKGETPGFGMSGAATKKAIMNAESILYPEGTNLALGGATFKADAASLTALTKQYNAVQAYENTSLKNLKMFTDAAAKIPDTGIPWLNTPVRALSQNLVGSTNMAAVNAARQVALTEIAKVVNNPNLTGALSDSARAEVMGLNPMNATLPQIRRVALLLQQDMANRSQSMADQIRQIKSEMGGKPASSGGTVQQWKRDASGRLVPQ